MERKWWTLIAVSVATFMLLLDITVVNTALPSIQEDLDATFTDLQWVIDAYTLSLAALVLTAGVLADRLGRRRVFAVGLGIFTVASLLAGLATDPTFLNLARALQGIGGAVMFAVSLALVAQEFSAGRERGDGDGRLRRDDRRRRGHRPARGRRAHRVARLGVDLLPERADRHRGHRDHATRSCARRAIPNASRIDWGGLVTFSSALFLLVLGLLRGNDEGWGSTLIVSLLAGAGVADGRVPRHRDAREASRCSRCTCSASAPSPACSWPPLGVSASMFALFLYLTFYLQGFLGRRPARGRAALPAADRDELLRRRRDRRAALAASRRGT